ncbi:MAG: glycerol-3-phosphate 1-O-acyltransferase PlsY [Lachnospiraceae bacterium]
MVGIRIMCLAIGYVFGLIQTSYFLGRANGIDIREHGSGNAGTTNTLRVLGRKAGLIVFLCDILKSFAAVLLVHFLFAKKYPDMLYLLKLYAGLGVILGHNYPFYLKFKGGKGIAAMGGMILGFHGIFALTGFIIFFGTFFISHYVSLASLILSLGFFVEMLIFGIGKMGAFASIPDIVLLEMYIVTFVISGMAFLRHHENIKKLLHGTERKTYLGKKKSDQ